jgi:peroxiredoxin
MRIMEALLVVALVLPWVFLAFETWLLYQLFRQQGRLLLTLSDLEDRIDLLDRGLSGESEDAPHGLPVGTPAPDFALPDLAGNERRLSEFLGQPLLVTFFDLGCGYCRQMAPALGKLPEDAPRVLLISRGTVEEHEQLVQEHGWRVDVVLDESREVSNSYEFVGTPTGYLVSADGVIASSLKMGEESVLSLTRPDADERNGDGPAPEEPTAPADADGRAPQPGRVGSRDITQSRIERDGLRAGTPAPEFTLPDLEGGEHSFTDLRGERTLLVFSDVDCEPCEALAPKLTGLYRQLRERGLEIVMVTRGPREENRKKARKYGFEFPVLLQKAWEVSKKYGIFSTPVGYLIDENGVITRNLARGGDEILALVDPAAATAD